MAGAEETAHIAAIQKQWWLKSQAAKMKHFKVVDGAFVQYAVDAPVFDLAATVAIAEHQQQEARAQAIANAEIGEMVKGEGVFLGAWMPHDDMGRSLGITFNVFAAPRDIADEALSFAEAVQDVAGIKNLCGHDGALFARDTNLYDAIRSGNYHGEWFVPPKELVDGYDNFVPNGTLKDHLYAHKDKGALKGSFNTAADNDNPKSSSYWSSSIDRFESVYNLDFANGIVRCWSPQDWKLRCRAVRLEPRAS